MAAARASSFTTLLGYCWTKPSRAAAFWLGSVSPMAVMYALYSAGSLIVFCWAAPWGCCVASVWANAVVANANTTATRNFFIQCSLAVRLQSVSNWKRADDSIPGQLCRVGAVAYEAGPCSYHLCNCGRVCDP